MKKHGIHQGIHLGGNPGFSFYKNQESGIFVNQFDSFVSFMGVQSTDKLIVSTPSTLYNGVSLTKRIIRLNTDLTIDNTWQFPDIDILNSRFDASIFFKILPDDKILVLGSNVGNPGTPNYFCRLNADGSIDNTFNCTITTPSVGQSIIQKGSLYVVSYSESGTGRFRTCNLDGSNFVNYGSLGSGFVNHLVLQANNRIVARGSFTSLWGTSRPGIARDDNNVNDPTFVTTGSSSSPSVRVLALQSTQRILSVFLNYRGVAYNRLIGIQSNGTIDGTFSAPTSLQPTFIEVVNSDKILCSGSFTAVGGDSTIKKICRLNANGSIDNTFNKIFDTLPLSDVAGNLRFATNTGASSPIYISTGNYLYKLDANGNYLI